MEENDDAAEDDVESLLEGDGQADEDDETDDIAESLKKSKI